MVWNIRDYGAVGDGNSDSTSALEAAITACSQSGGGQVTVPPGHYRARAFALASGVELYLAHGARLEASPELSEYVLNDKPGGFIRCYDAGDVAITGTGTIHGSGSAFAHLDQLQGPDGPVVMRDRPGNLVVFNNCQGIRLTDFTITDAPFWTIHLNGSRQARLENLVVDNPQSIPNNDCIHLTSTQDTIVTGCHLTAGDDPIAITGINDHARYISGFEAYHQPTRNIVVSDCILRTRSCAIRVGYGHNDVENCLFNNLIIEDSNRGIGVFVRNTGSLRNLTFRNLMIRTRFYDGNWWGNGEAIHISLDSETLEEPHGSLSGVTVDGFQATGPNGIVVSGCPGCAVEDISICNGHLCLTPDPSFPDWSARLDVRPTERYEKGFAPAETAAVQISHARNVEVQNLRVRTVPTGLPHLWQSDSEQVLSDIKSW